MPLVKLQFNPGVDKEGTDYENTIGWFDSDKVRFRKGFPEKIGGWQPYSDDTFIGTCRKILGWTSLLGSNYFGFGTHKKLYIDDGGAYADITPIRDTETLGADPIDVVDTSTTVTFNDTAHGAMVGDYVTISGVDSDVGGVPQAELNAEHEITTVPDADSYTVEVTTAATSTVTGDGGAAVVAAYQLNIGLDTEVLGTGWGTESWSDGGFGEAATTVTSFTSQLRLWSLETFGEDLVANIRNGGIYHWDTSTGTSVRAVSLDTLSGSSGAPTIARKILAIPETRYIMVLGCDSWTDVGTQDPMLIRWPDAESLTDWIPDTVNSAGDLRLSVGSQIITGLVTKRGVLVWTDTALSLLSFIGAPFFFGTKLVSSNTSIISPNATIEADEITYWMGKKNFYYYDGTVKTLPCSLREHVFNNLNTAQQEKVHVGLNRSESEITWYYPTTTDEITHYVVYNFTQDIWCPGTMIRTAYLDKSFNTNPVAAYTDGKLYNHELGLDDGTTTPASAINAYIESSIFEPVPGEGYHYTFASRLLPDVTFNGSEAANPAVVISITPRDYPGAAPGTSDSTTVTRTSTTPVEQFTKQASIRVRGRGLVYRIESTELGVFWREGSPRIEVRMDGRQ